MHIRFSITADDYREFQQAYLARLAGFWQRNHFKIFVFFGIVTAAAGLNWIDHMHRDNYYGLVCIVGGLFLVWRGIWLRFWQWRCWFSQNAEQYQNLEGEIDEGGVTLQSSTEKTKSTWEHYSKYAETENLILLVIPRGGSCLILPKRAFEPADLGAFRELLQKKFGKSAP